MIEHKTNGVHRVALEHFKTQVLLLHSEQSTLDSLSSGFSDRYTVHCATSGTEALHTLGSTPIHVIVSAQDLPGMSGLDALREAKKRSPETIGILLAGNKSDGLEALVGEKEVFQIVRGGITPDALRGLIDNATRQVRLLALAESANDTTADVDESMSEHIVMETSENGATIISDGTGRMPILDPKKVSSGTNVSARSVDVLVLTKDEEFLSTIRDSSRGLHNVHYANTVSQADEAVRTHKVGVAVIDAAMVGTNVEKLTLHLRNTIPRLVAIVAGRRDDGEMLMDLINRGKVYRFLLKPVSPGRARLAVDASVKHHLEAPDAAFAITGKGAPAAAPAKPAPAPQAKPKVAPPAPAAAPKATPLQSGKPVAKPMPVIEVSPGTDRLSDAFAGDDTSFTETMTGIVKSVGESLAGIRGTSKKDAVVKPAPSAVTDTGDSFLKNPKILGIGAAAVVVLASLTFWMLSGSDEPVAVEETMTGKPQITETDAEVVAPANSPSQMTGIELLEEARLARGAGQIVNPPGNNAIELYLAAAAAAPGDTQIASELKAVINQALANAELALLEKRLDNAQSALQRIALADPANARLPFLNAQLQQMQLQSLLDNARLAIRESRFEDAAVALTGARTLNPVDGTDIAAIETELSAARSQHRVDDVLAQAAARLAEGKLVAPSNDNARYYYELVLSNDRENSAARQGLAVIASQLVLQARTQIDRGNFNTAATLLTDAGKLDPSSTAVAETSTALVAARDREAQAARDEAARKAAAEQRAAAQRAAEQLAEEQRAEAQRVAADKQAAAVAAAAATAAKAPISSAEKPGSAVSGNVESGNAKAATESQVDEQAVAVEPVDEADSAVVANTQAIQEPPVARAALNDIPVAISSLNRVKYVAPKYPRAAQRRSISGWVEVVFVVTTEGLVRDVAVRSSEPGDTFVNSAVSAVEDWEFEPVIEFGKPVEKRAAVRMMFALE